MQAEVNEQKNLACSTIIEWMCARLCGNRLLERLRSQSPKSQVMFASAISGIADFFVYLAFIHFMLRPLC